jgi:hypothetical protein
MLNKKTRLIALFAGFAASEIMAGTLTNYTSGDVLLCFHKGTKDMVVDIGSVTALTSLSPNQRITISQYTTTQLNQLGDYNGLNWSAFTWLSDHTLFVTSPRSSLDVQTSPWLANSVGNQQLVDGRMANVPVGSASFRSHSPNGNNSSMAVIESSTTSGNANYTSGTSYTTALLGAYGGFFNGLFQGNPEIATAGDFTDVGPVVRSDFYSMAPTDGYAEGTWLGYFEFATNGVMTYVAYPSTPPVIQSISRTNIASTLKYTTGLYGTYTLRGTNTLTSGAAMINWPAISTLTSGDNSVHTVTDTTGDAIKFYTITAQ